MITEALRGLLGRLPGGLGGRTNGAARARALPRFVDYGALMTPPTPFRSLNTTLDGFWARADGERLDALCRKLFDEPSGGKVKCSAIGNHVMLTWGVIGRVTSLTPPYDERGGVREPQVAIWVPVVVRRPGQRDSFAMSIPYIWLDNAMSLATGRELFGYPKAWGWPAFPGPEDRPRKWGLDVFGLDYTRDALADRHPLLEIVEAPDEPGSIEDELHGLADIARHAAAQLLEPPDDVGLGATADLAGDLLREELTNVFLKQFRSIEDGLGAALQQIVEARYTVTRVTARSLVREHRLIVHELDSHPVARELGLADQPLGAAYHVDMDFDVGQGRVLWDADGRRAG